MKLSAIILALVGSSLNLLAQGLISLDNLNGKGGPTASSFGRFFNPDETPYTGPAINVTVSGGPTPNNLSPIVTLTGVNALMNFWSGVYGDPFGVYAVPGVPAGGVAWLEVDAWIGAAPSYDAAVGPTIFLTWNGSNYAPGVKFQNPTGTAGAARSLDGMPAMRLGCLEYPFIVRQPTNQVAYRGTTASFSVGTAFGWQTCQWRLNGTNLPGANSLSLGITNVQPSHAGNYSVVILGGGCGPNVVSSNATLTVVMETLGLTLATNPILTLEGAVGKTYDIQSTTNVALTNSWQHLTNLTLAAPVQTWVDTSANLPPGGPPQRFYRVVVLP